MRAVAARVHHVGIAVRDLDRSVAFYRSFFSFQVRVRGEFDGVPLAFLTAGGGAEVELVAEGPVAGPGPVSHLALAVDDLDGLLRRLAAAGYPPHLGPVTALGGLRVAFVHGPDGEEIELVARAAPAASAGDTPGR